LGAIGILYSPDKPEAINVATRQLAILLIPVLLSLNELDLEKYKWRLLMAFGYGCTVVIIYLFGDALHTILYFHLPLSSLYSLAFMNHNFSLPIEMHATYLSIYVAFSISIFLYALSGKPGLLHKWLYIFCILILSLGMLQLSSRAVFIALVLVVNFVFPFMLFSGRKRLRFFVCASLVSVLVFLGISNIDSFRFRYISELRKDLIDNTVMIEKTEPRMARWEATLELVKQAPVIGYGSGAEKELLKQMYFEKKFYNAYLNEFNAHNEYLSIQLKWGLVGLALYCCILFAGARIALKRKDLLFAAFMVIIAVVSVSENILDLNKGIFFYAFFFSFFLIIERSKMANITNNLVPEEATRQTNNPF
jgi:O-antigen ligase